MNLKIKSMGNCISKELEGDNAIEMIKPFCWQKKGLLMWFMVVKINEVRTS